MSDIRIVAARAAIFFNVLSCTIGNKNFFGLLKSSNFRESIKFLKSVKYSFNKIDDYIDSLNREDLINLSKLETIDGGYKKCDMLNNLLENLKNNSSSKFSKKFLEHVDEGDNLSRTLVSYGNMFCDMFKQEALSKISGDRISAVEMHQHISGVYGVFIADIFNLYANKESDFLTKIKSQDDASMKYPASYKLATCLQVFDDVYDCIVDLKEEKKSNLVSSNIWLDILNKSQKLDDLDKYEKNDQISFDLIKREFGNEYKMAIERARNLSSDLPYLSKRLLNLSIDLMVSGKSKTAEIKSLQ
jgi:hypothetical protein